MNYPRLPARMVMLETDYWISRQLVKEYHSKLWRRRCEEVVDSLTTVMPQACIVPTVLSDSLAWAVGTYRRVAFGRPQEMDEQGQCYKWQSVR